MLGALLVKGIPMAEEQQHLFTDEQMAEMAASCARACGGAKGSAKVLHQMLPLL